MVYLCILGVLFLSQWNQAQLLTDGDCYVEGISAEEWKTRKDFTEEVDDKDTEKIIFSGKYSNIESVGCDLFFCIKLDEENKLFQILPSPDFNKLDGNGTYERVNSSTLEIDSNIDVQCSNMNKTLTFKVTVRDTNNHPPTFTKPSYIYKLPMPMTPKNSITNLGDEIVVKDLDFSNLDVTFTSDFGDLSYETRYGEKGTFSYILQMEFTKVQKLTAEKTITLTATDSGTPPTSSNVFVTFSIDEEISEPPSFTEPSYLYDYVEEDKQIKARGDGLKLTENSWTGLKCSIPDPTYSIFFNDITLDGEEVKLSLKKPFDDETMAKQIIQVPIQCYHSKEIGTSDASIIISFPETSKDRVSFQEKKYTAQYVINGDSHEIKMTHPITLNGSPDNIILEVEDEVKEYFGLHTYTNGSVLTLLKALSQGQLKETEMSIIVKLLWKNGETQIDDAFITLLLPNGEEGVDFSEPIFTGDYDYSDDGEGNMDPIQITLSNSNVDIKNCGMDDSDYQKFFKLSCDDPAKLLLALNQKLPDNLLRTGTVPLSIWIDLSLGNIQRRIKSAVLLNLTYKGTTTTSTTTTSTTTPSTTTTSTTTVSPEADDCSHTGWIIVTIVLFILLVAYVIVSVVYYLKRIRGSTDSDFSESQKRTPKIEPHPHKRTSEKFKDVSTRRPTGFIRYNPDQDRTSVDSEYGDAQEEVNNNTNANKKSSNIDEEFRKISEDGNHNRRNIGFVIPTPPPEPPTMN